MGVTAGDIFDPAGLAKKHSTSVNLNTPPVAQYGRTPNGANDARDDAWSHMGDNKANQGALSGGMGYASGEASADRGPQAQEDYGLAKNEANSRYGHQNGSIGMARSLAYGNSPSQGAYQLQRGLDQGLAQQTAASRSARGGAAIATAGADAGANQAAMQQNAFSAARQLRASDMAQGRGMYSGMLGTQQQQDQMRLGQANDMSQYNAGANDKYRLGMGAAATGFGAAYNGGSQVNQGYYGLGMQPIQDQDTANQQSKGWSAQNQTQKVASDAENKAQDDKFWMHD